ncbi:hypothetical protein SLS53_003075, partial [Cytospora paraplurivora]
MVQKSRYLSWSRHPSKSKPKACLQYAMWTLAASLSSQFQLLRPDIYTESRRLLQDLESDEHDALCLEQVQAWLLLAIYELTSTTGLYQRGMMSAGRAFCLVQLMRLSEVDGSGQTSPKSTLFGGSGGQGLDDWVETESRRRTFWVAYTIDCLTSVVDGLPLTFHEQQIFTRLPAPDTDFAVGRKVETGFLYEAVNSADANKSSTFTHSVLIAALTARILIHKKHSQIIYRKPTASSEIDESSRLDEFVRKHQSLRTLLTRHLTALSPRLTSPTDQLEPMLVFMILTAYMAALALFEIIESRPLDTNTNGQVTHVTEAIAKEHQQRSLDMVHELCSLVSTLKHVNHFQTHPFAAIPLFSIARVCLKHLKHLGADEA